MEIIIPGKKLEKPSRTIEIVRPNGVYEFSRHVPGLQTSAKIKPSEYVLVHEGDVPEYKANSAISMSQGYNKLQFIPAQIQVLKDGLTVPTMDRFMLNYRNVNNAGDSQVRTGILYDASGDLIEGDKLKNYKDKLNSNCWAWLNAGFPKGTGFKGLDLSIVTGLDKSGQPIIKSVPLEDCLERDGWADLESLNSQGFPTKKAKVGAYEPGKTFYFWSPILRSDKPEEGYVARFVADSGGAYVVCYRDPQDSNPSLGVFPCAEGDAKN